MVAIWGFIGPEGGGKTTAMTYFSELHMALGGECRVFPGYDLYTPLTYRRVKQIEIHELVTMSRSLKSVIVDIDEIQQFNDSSRHMTVINQLTGYVGMQRRKLGLGMFYTLQNWMWLYDRMRWLTHFLTICTDMYYTPWGKANHISRGKFFLLRTLDCKGFVTGKPWSDMGTKILSPIGIFPYYRSYNVIDIFEGQRQIVIKKQQDIIDLRRDPSMEELKASASGPSPIGEVDFQEADAGLLTSLAEKGLDIATVGRVGRRLKKEV
ncbi:hypothetical protein DEHALATV1_0069 [Dehalococcoides mccartyi]|uniref:Zona occludens toxin N-terminal domain-containing protein n=1 Tax=Dehalococcoides mccartyi TaxID=61435 RepID=A0AB33HV04_9CHLR|nr:hypothetical protein [Dehalococcoides mccartyi]BAZ96697.1 hypothetical protein DEHALATV1_0069 [Dehalococcoides mccartyi]